MLANKVVCRYLFDVCNLLGCCIEEDANLLQNCLFTNTTSIGHYQGPPVLPGACPVAAWSTFLSHFFWTAMDQSYFCSMWLKSFNWSRTAASVLMHSQMTFKCTVTHFRQIPLSFLPSGSLYRTSTSLDGQQSSPSQFNKNRIHIAWIDPSATDVHFCAAVRFRCQYSTVSACPWSWCYFGQWSYTHRSRQPHRFCLLFPLTPAAFDLTISDGRHCTRHGSCIDPQSPRLL